jgi:hypothetical protein
MIAKVMKEFDNWEGCYNQDGKIKESSIAFSNCSLLVSKYKYREMIKFMMNRAKASIIRHFSPQILVKIERCNYDDRRKSMLRIALNHILDLSRLID